HGEEGDGADHGVLREGPTYGPRGGGLSGLRSVGTAPWRLPAALGGAPRRSDSGASSPWRGARPWGPLGGGRSKLAPCAVAHRVRASARRRGALTRRPFT